MKFLKYKYIAILSLSAGLSAGCSKKLEQANPNAQTTSSYWKTASDALAGVNGAYSPLLEDGMYMRFTPILLDVRGDDIRSNSPWTAISNVGKFALGTSVADGYGWTFSECYEGVLRSNEVLDYVPSIDMDATTKNQILGQAYFTRGLYFFHLVNLFGNVPLPLHVAQSKKDFYLPQSTQADGWLQVEADFKQAAGMLPVSWPGASDLGRPTKGAAMAFLGKAYLFNKQYSDAATQFKAVIDLGIYGLMDNYKDNFTESAENNKESIFEIQFSLTAGGTDLGWQGTPIATWGKTSARAITFGAPNFGWTDVQPSFSVFNEFFLEKTKDSAVDPRLDATIFYNKAGEPLYQTTFDAAYLGTSYYNDIFCRKYENGDGNKVNEYDWKSGINERIMRYADVLLMYGECQNELGNVSDCANYVTMVRDRVRLPDRTAEFAAYTQAQMRDQLAHERLLEFCLEGHRFDDIHRWGWLSDPVKLALLKSRDAEFSSYIPGKELYPIPQAEIDNNPGVKQNPTY